MRQLIYILVMVNLVFFLWQLFQSDSGTEAAKVLPPLPSNVRALVTLDERVQKNTESGVSDVDALTNSQPPGAGATLNCLVLGPFLAIVELEESEQRLVAMGLEPGRRSTEEQEQIGYWIYLPAMEHEEAVRITRLLDEKKDKEYFIGKDNIISLGAFKEKYRADIRVKKVRKYGLEPILEPRYRTRNLHWLDIQPPASGEVELETLKAEYSAIGIQEAACESIADNRSLN